MYIHADEYRVSSLQQEWSWRNENRHGVAVSCCILLILRWRTATAWRFSKAGSIDFVDSPLSKIYGVGLLNTRHETSLPLR